MEFLELLKKVTNPEVAFEVEKKVTIPEIEDFYYTIKSFSNVFEIFESTDDANKFMLSCPDLMYIYGKEKLVELFYGAKTGALITGVKGAYIPTQVHYTLLKLKEAYPNEPMLAIDKGRKLINKMLGFSFAGMSIMEILENVYDRDIKLITEEVPYVPTINSREYRPYYEVYVRGSEDIALIDKTYLDTFSNQEIRELRMTEDGLMIKNKLLRTDDLFKGILTNDNDLRVKIINENTTGI